MGHGHRVLHQRAAEVRKYVSGPWDIRCGKLQAWSRVSPEEDMCASGDITGKVSLLKPFRAWEIPSQAPETRHGAGTCVSPLAVSLSLVCLLLPLPILSSCFWNRGGCSVPLSIWRVIWFLFYRTHIKRFPWVSDERVLWTYKQYWDCSRLWGIWKLDWMRFIL